MYLIDEEKVLELVKDSFSFRELIIKLGIRYSSSTKNRVQLILANKNIDLSHFKSLGSKRGGKYKYTFEEIFKENSKVSSSTRLRFIIENKIIEYKCFLCKIETWMDKKISLEHHHINGNPKDNRLENLMMLCPNCHSQTHNYKGKNVVSIIKFVEDDVIKARGKTENIHQICKLIGIRRPCKTHYYKIRRILESKGLSFDDSIPESKHTLKLNKCATCDKMTLNKFCSYRCHRVTKEKLSISKEELKEMLIHNSPALIAKKFFVTFQCVKKRMKKYNLI